MSARTSPRRDVRVGWAGLPGRLGATSGPGRGALAGGLLVLAVSAGPALAAPALAASGAAPETRACTEIAFTDPPAGPWAATSAPLESMGVVAAQQRLARRGLLPGAGVTVAVLDTGISSKAGLRVAAGVRPSGPSGPPVDPHGTIVAGLVAAPARPGGEPVGVAPGASLVDVRVLDSFAPQEGQAGPSAVRVAEGLEHVLAEVRGAGGGGGPVVDLVNVSLAVPADPRIDAAVAALWQEGVVVVAEAGDRPADESDPLFTELGAWSVSEDAAPLVHPAGARGGPDDEPGHHVVGVGAVLDGTDPGSRELLSSSAVDVAAPTGGAVSLGLNGGSCGVSAVSTSWAAAEVTGVLALLMSAYPDDSPAQVVDRLVGTADGRPDVRSPLLGAGVVQAEEALARGLQQIGPDGTGSTRAEVGGDPASAPRPEPDLLAAIRDDAVWWGVLGGGALLLALVLRPVLARRTP
ncbi:M-protease precursor [Nocardioides dokdonensis FR1436]|uniref:M-protease n=1 Tax=Nocardioides dokdonensis FR1436 TaxID=1300347 RepID=A0A1A9GI02_9ACTN|nr:S8 family serine peptidase [Nocardioides dokdonensis]ANH37959.1 M-protease precursor [Nocardioides dokdonensis FR1436]